MGEMYTKSSKAYAKINIALDVTGVRGDGYHLVDMIMQTIDIYDDISVGKSDSSDITMECDNPILACDESNLCIKAASAVLKEFGIKSGVHIKLKKRIPMAAGLAGGSSDAAAVARCIRDIFDIDVSDQKLQELMLSIGADVPYLIRGGLARARGVGEVLDAIMHNGNKITKAFDNDILLIKPNFDVSTRDVYIRFDDIPSNKVNHPDIESLVDNISSNTLDSLFDGMGNVLEDVTASMYPEIRNIKDIMIRHGAKVSLMSGSGPSVFGVYTNTSSMLQAKNELEQVYCSADVFITKAI